MHYSYKFTTALAVIYTNCQAPTWHQRDLILLPLTQLMWDPGHRVGVRKGSLHEHPAPHFCRWWKGAQWRPPACLAREVLTLLSRDTLCIWAPLRIPSITETHLTQGFTPSPGGAHPNSGWSQGHSLMNKQFSKHASFQIRVYFPWNPTWDKSLVEDLSSKLQDVVFIFSSPHFGLYSAIHLECQIQPLVQDSSNVPFLQTSPQSFASCSGLP